MSNFVCNTSHKITSHWPSHVFYCLLPLYSLLFGSGEIILTCSHFPFFCLCPIASFSYPEQHRNKSVILKHFLSSVSHVLGFCLCFIVLEFDFFTEM